MTVQREQNSDWTPCRTGEIGGLVRRMRWKRRKPVVIGSAAACGAALVVAAIFFSVPHGPQPVDGEYHFGGIACSEVQAHAPQYMMGQLDPELRRRIDLHLAECPECGPRFRKMLDEPQTPAVPGSASILGRFLGVPTASSCRCAKCRAALMAHPRQASRSLPERSLTTVVAR